MPSVILEYNGEEAKIPHCNQTVKTLNTQAKVVFGLDMPQSRIVLVDKRTSTKAFSPLKANAGDSYFVYVLPEGTGFILLVKHTHNFKIGDPHALFMTLTALALSFLLHPMISTFWMLMLFYL